VGVQCELTLGSIHLPRRAAWDIAGRRKINSCMHARYPDRPGKSLGCDVHGKMRICAHSLGARHLITPRHQPTKDPAHVRRFWEPVHRAQLLHWCCEWQHCIPQRAPARSIESRRPSRCRDTSHLAGAKCTGWQVHGREARTLQRIAPDVLKACRLVQWGVCEIVRSASY